MSAGRGNQREPHIFAFAWKPPPSLSSPRLDPQHTCICIYTYTTLCVAHIPSLGSTMPVSLSQKEIGWIWKKANHIKLHLIFKCHGIINHLIGCFSLFSRITGMVIISDSLAPQFPASTFKQKHYICPLLVFKKGTKPSELLSIICQFPPPHGIILLLVSLFVTIKNALKMPYK